eukprot:584123-Rhodomonas_salina.1
MEEQVAALTAQHRAALELAVAAAAEGARAGSPEQGGRGSEQLREELEAMTRERDERSDQVLALQEKVGVMQVRVERVGGAVRAARGAAMVYKGALRGVEEALSLPLVTLGGPSMSGDEALRVRDSFEGGLDALDQPLEEEDWGSAEDGDVMDGDGEDVCAVVERVQQAVMEGLNRVGVRWEGSEAEAERAVRDKREVVEQMREKLEQVEGELREAEGRVRGLQAECEKLRSERAETEERTRAVRARDALPSTEEEALVLWRVWAEGSAYCLVRYKQSGGGHTTDWFAESSLRRSDPPHPAAARLTDEQIAPVVLEDVGVLARKVRKLEEDVAAKEAALAAQQVEFRQYKISAPEEAEPADGEGGGGAAAEAGGGGGGGAEGDGGADGGSEAESGAAGAGGGGGEEARARGRPGRGARGGPRAGLARGDGPGAEGGEGRRAGARACGGAEGGDGAGVEGGVEGRAVAQQRAQGGGPGGDPGGARGDGARARGVGARAGGAAQQGAAHAGRQGRGPRAPPRTPQDRRRRPLRVVRTPSPASSPFPAQRSSQSQRVLHTPLHALLNPNSLYSAAVLGRGGGD